MTAMTAPGPANLPLTVKVASSLRAVPASAWDSCARGAARPEGGEDTDNPFVSHAFLSSIEDSGCVGEGTGWRPMHLLVEDRSGTLRAAAPCYLKTHSLGEYVFDHAWADAYMRAGGRYYPKLQVCVPFTPVTGPRLLAAESDFSARQYLAAGLEALRAQVAASSIHVTFLPESEAALLADEGYLRRKDHQFHWMNEGYATFDDFVSALASRKRKTIRRERRDALSRGITIEWLTGRDITEAHWDAFFAFYMDTGSRKWGRPYLNRRFFSFIGERMADRVVLMMAKRAGRYIAGAINFVGRSRLFGRNWGCIEDHPFLHFEVCYYQAIDYAIAHGLQRVEAGAQGEHKLARGYRPVLTHSGHAFADPSFRRAVASYLERERAAVDMGTEQLADATPFRHTDEAD
jgi:predicted N-acyltransferase